ncbi:uncharacterized protein [Zea mays]|uniref:uncharacterized protein n=1 Tax=Zea mays TaxID=4577 RepID=UPI001653110A|nr:uncharacterized protein LOC103635869 [Zea mays]
MLRRAEGPGGLCSTPPWPLFSSPRVRSLSLSLGADSATAAALRKLPRSSSGFSPATSTLEMQVDTEPFPMNMIDFEGKKVLVRPNTADKGKGKETIIGNAKKADGDCKISCRKVVSEKTPDGGETLKVTITASSTGGQAQTGRQMQEPVLRIPDGPTRRRGRSGTPPDGPESSSRRSGHAQDSQRPRTFKPRRPEIAQIVNLHTSTIDGGVQKPCTQDQEPGGGRGTVCLRARGLLLHHESGGRHGRAPGGDRQV